MAAAVKNAPKESLVGTAVSGADFELSAQTKANFEKYARKDESGESYMTEEEFVNAIVPRDENFVGFQSKLVRTLIRYAVADYHVFGGSAQNQTRTIWYPISC